MCCKNVSIKTSSPTRKGQMIRKFCEKQDIDSIASACSLLFPVMRLTTGKASNPNIRVSFILQTHGLIKQPSGTIITIIQKGCSYVPAKIKHQTKCSVNSALTTWCDSKLLYKLQLEKPKISSLRQKHSLFEDTTYNLHNSHERVAFSWSKTMISYAR